MEETRESHESYGKIVIRRAKCTPARNLYGSSIKHRNLVQLEIHESYKERMLNNDLLHLGKTLISIEMSMTQFAEMISSVSQGDGVPVTIIYNYGKYMEECPEINQRQVIDNEFDDIMKKYQKSFDDLSKIEENIKSLSKIKQDIILNEFHKFKWLFNNHLPFIKKQFTEHMDKTVLEAKGEIEAYKKAIKDDTQKISYDDKPEELI